MDDPPDMTPRIGLVGCGRWGRNWARVLRDAGMLAWVSDPSPGALEMARRQAPDVPTFPDFPYWEAEATDGVVVATPPDTHKDVAVLAASHGMGVLVEKPMATTAADAASMVGAAHDADVPLLVGHTFLHARSVDIMSGWVSQRMVDGASYVRMDWLQPGTNSGDVGVVWNLAPHPLSVAVAALFPPGTEFSLEAVFSAARGSGGRLDLGVYRFLFGDAIVDVNLSHAHPEKVREITVVGAEGTILCRPNQGEVTWAPTDPAEGVEQRTAIRPEPLAALAAEFGRACTVGTMIYDPNVGVAVVSMMEMMQAASRRVLAG